jgi:Flp pilus assembly protein TadB
MSELQVPDKLRRIEEAQEKDSALTQAAIAFAIVAFVASTVGSTAPLYQKIVAVFLVVAGLCWLFWGVAKWRKLGKELDNDGSKKTSPR